MKLNDERKMVKDDIKKYKVLLQKRFPLQTFKILLPVLEPI